jgi:hypothetical protein
LPQGKLLRKQIHHAPQALQLLHPGPNAGASLREHRSKADLT